MKHMKCALISLVKCFSEGGFVVSVTGRPWHSIAVDEAHEMCINKSVKCFSEGGFVVSVNKSCKMFL